MTAEPPRRIHPVPDSSKDITPPKKRRWMPWWKLENPTLAMCPHCSVPCVVYCTETLESGRIAQHRKCPVCDRTVKTLAGGLE